MNDAEFLLWIHDRLRYVYGENYNADFMHKLRELIKEMIVEEERPWFMKHLKARKKT